MNFEIEQQRNKREKNLIKKEREREKKMKNFRFNTNLMLKSIRESIDLYRIQTCEKIKYKPKSI